MFSANVFGQINNLVPNGDFEDIDSCFKQIDGIWKIGNWNAAVSNIYSSSDYYNKCQANYNWLPNKPISEVNGNGSAAIILSTTSSLHREYIQTETKENLLKDTVYMIQMKIKPLYIPFESEWGIKRIEVLLSNYRITAPIVNNFVPSRIDTCPSLIFKGYYSDTISWYSLSHAYKAQGNEKYITIGTFSADSLIEIFPIGTINFQSKQAYYLIDDVMVYKASDTIKQQPEPVLPNVFSPNQDGVNEVYAIENLPESSTLEVFNRWGGLVFTQAPYQNNWPGNAPNGQPVADGVYFAILTYQDAQGLVQQKKQTVHVVR
jgi:gliding motility-associated-like protein